jgi:hypothetical protein
LVDDPEPFLRRIRRLKLDAIADTLDRLGPAERFLVIVRDLERGGADHGHSA